jgi:23S rRNA pseudouridine1911/1915/1917 synthase
MTVKDMSQKDAAGDRYDFRVGESEAGGRLDRFLAERPEIVAAHLSRSRIKALIEEGRVALRGAAAMDPARKIAAGDAVALTVPPPEPAAPQPEPMALDIVYEDRHLIVIDKPAGLVVHPASGHESGTLVNALIAHW